MSPHLEPVAELESVKTRGNSPRSPGFSSVDQLLYASEASRRSPSSTPREDDALEGDHSHHKKSLFGKMKEKARKLKHSLSNKKKYGEEGDTTPSWSARSEDREAGEEEEEEGDPEYFGAPMYESEMAPVEMKETARQHPRADPVIPENHVLSVPAKHGSDLEQQKPTGSDMTKTGYAPENLALADKKEESWASKSKTVAETVTEKLAPAYAKVSDVTQAIGAKIQGLAVSASMVQNTERGDVSGTDKPITIGTDNPVDSESKVWDKGVSVKEYIMQKFEPGEDDRALSRVISEAISPRKASGHGGTVWRAEAIESAPISSGQRAPISTNTHEIAVAEEEKHGKVLQLN
ncbi:PREDICTED: low-temperature-induced 65 kDa protein [Tarenaya hassleriana]|uniref:low-temperature-induced 65 kDa protein n=1 Tax=Tarenaya hassleriana TaxID=28532 RepID=UPI00053C6514|nr:PREDICTED: low-temperature-induced 65 kDa protein [Tarenaya hassleriana]XP_010520260.1 PREDICTED: low-temperature-induced 65 kDa protein [Tarenaya hassleriana]XP_010520261.1 PREDICTED: low-temperature-induced 65 kDa protein [Tarenaya hassleriana]XP_010520262.1 PREDICTED: low-temperature-induced 65 kDa protein [Tarenaya hassleriana]XP_010520263.1 PREDICTED: low-temperature-induced 65 kDa protein [Tarenaya hassleriana]